MLTVSSKELIKEYIKVAAFDRSSGDGTLNANTNAMKALVKQLNSPDTPLFIKEEFVDCVRPTSMSLESIQGKRKDEYKKNLRDFKFTQSDFSFFINKNQPEVKKKIMDKIKVTDIGRGV